MKILYLYNKVDWAIHNVGKLWLRDLSPDIKVDFVNYKDIQDKSIFGKYDFIWFGYFLIYLNFNHNPLKTIVTVHDPMELYPQTPTWKHEKIIEDRFQILKNIPNIVTISSEMFDSLLADGLKTTVINTTSNLPLREVSNITTNKCDVHSVFQTYPRKNPEMLEKVKVEVGLSGIKFDTKIGLEILPQKEYIQLLDQHEIYVCTSYQEGGPLPAMDAMKRGSVILTTPVGQIQELIENGVNGFICTTEDEFISRILLLANDKNLLQSMRIKSLKTIEEKRNDGEIRDSVLRFIKGI